MRRGGSAPRTAPRFADAEALLFVAPCTAKVEALDAAHDGAVVGTAATGAGVDDFDYSPAQHALYVGAAKDANLYTVVQVASNGALATAATVTATQPGARNGVVDLAGRVYLAHGQGCRDDRGQP